MKKNNDNIILRISVEGGGCSGFQYILKIDDKNSYNSEKDELINKNGFVIVVEKESLPYLKGAKLEYKESMIKSGFQIAENPNSEMNCSCGSSFSPKNTKI